MNEFLNGNYLLWKNTEFCTRLHSKSIYSTSGCILKIKEKVLDIGLTNYSYRNLEVRGSYKEGELFLEASLCKASKIVFKIAVYKL